jgi:tRNA(Ile)-lysidine synthase TilS/MesJ
MGATDIFRPLITWTKAQILQYALDHKLERREDETNHQPVYLRNVLRQKMQDLPIGTKEMLFELFERQTRLRQVIDRILTQIINQSGRYRRYGFIMAEDSLAQEVLAFVVKWHTGVSLTHPQLERAVLAIKTARQGEVHQLAAGAELVFNISFFVVKTDKK